MQDNNSFVKYIDEISQNVLELKNYFQQFENIAKKICIKLKNKNSKIIFIGNGGSAAESQHFAAELIGKFNFKRKSIPAIALTTDTSILTSIGNDYTFDYIFKRQLEGLANKNDIIIFLTTSFKSKNILKSIKFLNTKKIDYYILTSYQAKKNKTSNNIVYLPGKNTARNQEMHLIYGHLLCEYIENYFK